MLKNLVAIQNELKAPKSNYNSFGKYSYRSAEDILTAVKPLLKKYDCQMTISDEVIAVGNRIYIKAIVTIADSDGNTETVTAFARESEEKKGMDGSQITGTASSYARKYALNGLFLIDDTKDADTDEYKKETAPADDPIIDRQFLELHGSEKITSREIKKLTAYCKKKGGNMTIENAVRACGRNDVSDITFTQYMSLCAQMGEVA